MSRDGLPRWDWIASPCLTTNAAVGPRRCVGLSWLLAWTAQASGTYESQEQLVQNLIARC